MNQVFIATKNTGKVDEFAAFFSEKGIQVKSLLDIENPIDVVEDGSTFEANAIKKAETVGKHIGEVVIADDSGLEVDALNGAPGIYSARFAGEDKSDEANNKKLLNELKDIPQENITARFVCVLAIYIPGETTKTIRGTCEGLIADEIRGEQGFGYDPLFYLPSLHKTMAQLTRGEKNKISHRANALMELAKAWDSMV
ncbi:MULTISPECIES: XTP/dITP diphosphatase [Bacillaceae]|uniref:dITP/XTP pyrophosphatase n=1 Tax=Evansella alkalicola TaxID=745819 RepID=A0ABS6JTQ0_9BACI|nr:XTP/dITP diphosphatase [Litchfieldia alkalitelluris]MBU9721963.1 XTP/dITP diphosphatase [Bacillus alkalicola]